MKTIFTLSMLTAALLFTGCDTIETRHPARYGTVHHGSVHRYHDDRYDSRYDTDRRGYYYRDGRRYDRDTVVVNRQVDDRDVVVNRRVVNRREVVVDREPDVIVNRQVNRRDVVVNRDVVVEPSRTVVRQEAERPDERVVVRKKRTTVDEDGNRRTTKKKRVIVQDDEVRD
ncbi:MAG TPA: hypothetical protein VF585_10285 [Chthoniobacterales bacterium]|jgi:hypothetical protein